jgi:tetratricopeptide (TPR) repeat protein
VWQELRAELHPRGLEIVTVALESGGAEIARPWIEAAHPEHPSLIDAQHVCDALFGIVNVPSGVWIDERGTIVRPPETAYPRRPAFLDRVARPDATPRQRAAIDATRRLRVDAEGYITALRDWVEHGARSRYALAAEDVLGRSRPRPRAEGEAAAHFALALALALRDGGDADRATEHFREAHRLQPENWTYKRQAWALAGADRDRLYGTEWLTEVERMGGPERYYPPLEL